MTIKQIVEITGASYDTVKTRIRELYPEKTQKGKKKQIW